METLLQESYFALFLIVSLGIAVGQIKVQGISLDVSAVIFVALLFGYWGATVPADFQKIGLILFIYTVGLQSGAGFFEAFRKHGRELVLLAVCIVGSAAVVAWVAGHLVGIDSPLGVGLFAGALTSTPGLAAAIESSNSPVASVGYGMAYPFGVVGVILFIRLLPRLLGVNVEEAERLYVRQTRAEHPEILSRNFVVENRNLDGETIGELELGTMTGANISRAMHDGVAVTPNRNTRLYLGDLVKAVGPAAALDKVRWLIGSSTDREIPLSQGYEVQWFLVTNKEVVNRTLGQMNLLAYNATVTRIRRAGIDLAPGGQTRLRMGDKLMIAVDRENMGRVAQLLGNDDKRLSETDFLPIALGIVLGVVLGTLRFPVGGLSLSLGTTGGVLAAGLLLSWMGKTGPIIWTMSGYSNQLLRQLGLLFFLAAVGTEAGAHLPELLAGDWPALIAAGAAITLIPMIIGVLVGSYVLKLNFLTLAGVITGSMTSTPGLAAVSPMTDSDGPAVAYATVYPIALVAMILACQILGRL